LKKVYLNSSYEKTNTLVENGFEVDNQIADIIILLNKKGYNTINSCAGHYKEDTTYKETVLKNKITEEEFFKYLSHYDLKFIDEDENNYYYEGKIIGESTYIMFEKDIVLPFYPEGFDFDEIGNDVSRKLIFYHDEEKGQNKKNQSIIDLEIKNAIKCLETWAIKLPVIKVI